MAAKSSSLAPIVCGRGWRVERRGGGLGGRALEAFTAATTLCTELEAGSRRAPSHGGGGGPRRSRCGDATRRCWYSCESRRENGLAPAEYSVDGCFGAPDAAPPAFAPVCPAPRPPTPGSDPVCFRAAASRRRISASSSRVMPTVCARLPRRDAPRRGGGTGGTFCCSVLCSRSTSWSTSPASSPPPSDSRSRLSTAIASETSCGLGRRWPPSSPPRRPCSSTPSSPPSSPLSVPESETAPSLARRAGRR